MDGEHLDSSPIRRVGLIIDSSSQIPHELVDRFDVEVVPITVAIDGANYREGIDLDADAFYHLVGDPLPDITTSQPSPGEFLAAFEATERRGCDAALCVTVGSDHSGTFNSARIAADRASIPVRLVDSGSLSFGVTACLWEAAASLDAGADVDAAAARAEALAPEITSTFLLTSLDQVRKMGRVDLDDPTQHVDETAVYLTRAAQFDTLGSARSVSDLVQLMTDPVPTESPIRVGVCLAAPETAVYTEAIEAALAVRPNIIGITRYRIGPSMAAHTGPGTAGLFFWPSVPA